MNRTTFLYNIALLIVYAESLGIRLICFTFYRSPEEQLRMFQEGKSKVKSGKHQKWLAMDFAILDYDGSAIWELNEDYKKLGEYWESLGGVWGGRFTSLGDHYHFEG